ncbi:MULTISPECIES: hypothetical protein [Streptacidiphilus]|uniref:Uncharacterized protein n=1 Tax=Streptacidiphilus cavernicola TaxID=3342716 RepID=A0ABV6UPZ8_9ACTN|nr:hypothetical protein [Streptacidiphilus jeojiense]
MNHSTPPTLATIAIGTLLTLAVATIGTSITFDVRLARVLFFGGLPRSEYFERRPKAKVGTWAVGIWFMIAGWLGFAVLAWSWLAQLL